MALPISRLSRNCADRLTSITSSHHSVGCSAAGWRLIVPALFTRISGTILSAASVSANPSNAALSEKSTAWPVKLRPIAVTARPTSLSSGFRLALTPIISAPACASASAMARPMPRFAPVTSAVFPERSNIETLDMPVILLP